MVNSVSLSWQHFFSSLAAHWRIKPQALWQFLRRDLSIDGVGVEAWSCDYQGLVVGFLLLQYSVVYAVESLSWFHLLFISQFVLSSG